MPLGRCCWLRALAAQPQFQWEIFRLQLLKYKARGGILEAPQIQFRDAVLGSAATIVQFLRLAHSVTNWSTSVFSQLMACEAVLVYRKKGKTGIIESPTAGLVPPKSALMIHPLVSVA